MNSMKRNILMAMATVQGFLVTSAMAHPGPPGHTHSDDWPFGPLSFVVLGAILTAVAAGTAWNRCKPARARKSR
jgi:hypothetical protein